MCVCVCMCVYACFVYVYRYSVYVHEILRVYGCLLRVAYEFVQDSGFRVQDLGTTSEYISLVVNLDVAEVAKFARV